jgi:hypothetical protein
MSIQSNKLMNLADGKVLYDDLRQRIEQGGSAAIDDTAGAGDTDKAWSADKLTEEFAEMEDLVVVQDATPTENVTKVWLPATPPQSVQVPTYGEFSNLLNAINVLKPAATASDVGKFLKVKTVADGKPTAFEYGESGGGGSVDDVQINGTSIVSSGVANVPVANDNTLGVVKSSAGYGIAMNGSTGYLYLNPASDNEIKAGLATYKALVPGRNDKGVFYGLAKAAGDSTQSSSSNAIGNYTEDAKSSISEMLNGAVSVSGTTPSITAKAGVRYICGEVSTLTIVVPASGCIDVTFTSGSTATVLTVTPPTGQTMMWANGFDPSSLDANTTYEINIMDGCLGVAGSWS